MSHYQKGKTNLDFTEARDSEWQWHQLGLMQVCTSLQTDNHASNPPLKFFTGRMPFLPPNQQRQSTEGTINTLIQRKTIYAVILPRCRGVSSLYTSPMSAVACCVTRCKFSHGSRIRQGTLSPAAVAAAL